MAPDYNVIINDLKENDRHSIFQKKDSYNEMLTDIRHFKKKDAIDSRLDMSNHQEAVPKTKLSAGSVANKFPVILDDGRTVVYISDKSREREIRLRYALGK